MLNLKLTSTLRILFVLTTKVHRATKRFNIREKEADVMPNVGGEIKSYWAAFSLVLFKEALRALHEPRN